MRHEKPYPLPLDLRARSTNQARNTMMRFSIFHFRFSIAARAQGAGLRSFVQSKIENRKSKILVSLLLLGFALLATACAPATQTAKTQYMFWPASPDAPHIQFLTSISSTRDITGRQAQLDTLLYGKETTSDLPFARPYGIRMYNGCIYVCDATMNDVSILDLRKKEVRILGSTGEVRLLKPIDIAVAPDGIKYIADTGYGAIVVFKADDTYAGRITVPKLRPVSLAVQGNELYVADIYACVIRVFDRFNGKELRTIGKPLTPQDEKGALGGVMGIAVNGQGDLFADDVIGCRVQEFSPEGKFMMSIGKQGVHPGNFVRPKHMAVDSDGILYVVDNAIQNVQMFDSQGRMLTFFGFEGTHPGAMESPAGICVTDSDLDLFQKFVNPDFQIQRLILVTNNAGPAKINVYGLGALKPGKTVADISNSRINAVIGFTQQPDTTALPAEPSGGEPGTQPASPAAPQPATQPAAPPATRPAPTSQPAGSGLKPF